MRTTNDPACGNEPSLPAGSNPPVDVIRHLPLATLKAYARNARRHGDRQIDLIARSTGEARDGSR